MSVISNSYSPFTRAITTIIDRGKLVARVTVEGAARDLYDGNSRSNSAMITGTSIYRVPYDECNKCKSHIQAFFKLYHPYY